MAVKKTGNNEVLVSMDRVAAKILFIRGQKVMLDSDLAELYEVEAKVLNQAVKRNIERFPADFMFQLTAEEVARLRSQFVTLKTGRGQHRKYQPYAFTEQGVTTDSYEYERGRIERDAGGMRIPRQPDSTY